MYHTIKRYNTCILETWKLSTMKMNDFTLIQWTIYPNLLSSCELNLVHFVQFWLCVSSDLYFYTRSCHTMWKNNCSICIYDIISRVAKYFPSNTNDPYITLETENLKIKLQAVKKKKRATIQENGNNFLTGINMG